jgi:hypothetical protein
MQAEPARQTKPITASVLPKRESPHTAAGKARHPALIAIACILARRAAQEWMIPESEAPTHRSPQETL